MNSKETNPYNASSNSTRLWFRGTKGTLHISYAIYVQMQVTGSRQPCKRCFIHVYLARFINTQQNIQQNPLRAEPNMNMRARSFDFRHYNLKGSHPGKMVCAPSSMSGLTSFSGSKSPGSRSSRPVSGSQNQESQTIVSQEKGLIPIVSSPHNEQILHIEVFLTTLLSICIISKVNIKFYLGWTFFLC